VPHFSFSGLLSDRRDARSAVFFLASFVSVFSGAFPSRGPSRKETSRSFLLISLLYLDFFSLRADQQFPRCSHLPPRSPFFFLGVCTPTVTIRIHGSDSAHHGSLHFRPLLCWASDQRGSWYGAFEHFLHFHGTLLEASPTKDILLWRETPPVSVISSAPHLDSKSFFCCATLLLN